MIQKIRSLSLPKRTILFISSLAIWLLIAKSINSSFENPIARASNLQTLWILSSFLLGGLWLVFFRKKKMEKK